MSATLKDVVHAPQTPFNILFDTKLMIESLTLSGDKNKMPVFKGAAEMLFDNRIKMQQDQLCCVVIQLFRELGFVVVELSESKEHEILGHSSYDSTINTAKSLGWKLTGCKQICESFHLANAKQNNVSKASIHEPTTSLGEQVV